MDRDRFARITKTSLEGKEVLTPNFSPLIQNERELDIYLQRTLSPKDNEHLGTFVMRIFDAYNILLPLIRTKNQVDIEGKPIPSLYSDFLEKTVFFIDPATEYLKYDFYFYKFLQLARRVRFPRPIMTYLRGRENRKKNSGPKFYKKWKNKEHKDFWYKLDRDQRRRNDLITDYFDLESRFETKILIPPMPIVENVGLLDIAIRINDISKALAINRGECATYFLLSKKILRNEKIIDKIIDYLVGDPSKLTIFKFKNLTLWTTGSLIERESFRKLMQELSKIRKYKKEKLFMLLEASLQSFPSASYGFDIVSSSMRLLDIDSSFGHSGYGGYFNEDILWNIDYEKLPEIMMNNGGRLPCPCNVCRKITLDNAKRELLYNGRKITFDEWYEHRRGHNLFVMNSLMKMIHKAVEEKHVELIREKLINSEIRNLKVLIPRFYQ